MIASLAVLVLQRSRISIPLGTYSYQEIAQRLSTPDCDVVVASSISNRGALISLRDRTQPRAIAAICQGLDLQPLTIRIGHVKLEPNSNVELRERRWRAGLAKILTGAWELRKAGFTELAQLDKAALEARIAKVLSGPKPLDSDTWTDLQIVRQAGPLATACVALINSSPSDLPVDFLSTRIQRDPTSESLSPAMTDQVQKAKMRRGDTGSIVLYSKNEIGASHRRVTTIRVGLAWRTALWIASWAVRSNSCCTLGDKLFSGMLSDWKSQRNRPGTLERSTKA